MDFCLEKVSADKKDVLFNLLQFALYEGSFFTGNEINDDGIFPYKWFDSYFNDNNRDAYFIKDGNKYLGFIMLNDYLIFNNEGRSIAEFLILPQYRRRHLGMNVVFSIFDMYRGYFEIKPINREAYLFWKRVINEYTSGNYLIKNDNGNEFFLFNIK